MSGVKLHMDGLEALVKSRGGITTIADPIPRRVVTWADSEGKQLTECLFLAEGFSLHYT